MHPRLSGRASPSILDYGYAFLATPEQQPGLVEAAARMNAFHDEVSTITDNVVVYTSLGGAVALVRPEDGFADLPAPDATAAAADGDRAPGLALGLLASSALPHSALQRALEPVPGGLRRVRGWRVDG